MSEYPPERPALYYPYIHIRSEHWLKATLLFFPKVFRMIPWREYAPEDEPRIQRYVQPDKPTESLLDSRGTAAEEALVAQQVLLHKIQANEELIKERYAREISEEKYLIHHDKMDPTLREYLLDRKLARPHKNLMGAGHGAWLALDPLLGNAIMTTIALAIARQYGFDIVTDQITTHETLISTNQDQIFERLISGIVPPATDKQAPAHELGQLVIGISGINLNALQPSDIIELKREKKDFREFRKLLFDKAAELGEIPDHAERHQRLQPIAEEIIQAWHDYQRAFPRRLADALFARNIKAPDVIPSVFGPVAIVIAAVAKAGLAIAMLAYSGYRIYDDYQQRGKSPYRWLSRIATAQDTCALLAFPLGLETYTNENLR